MAKLISIGQIIDTTWDVYASNFKPLMRISLWGYLIGLFTFIRLVLLPDGENASIARIIGGDPDQMAIVGFAIATGIALIAIPVTSIWIYMNLVRGADHHFKDTDYTFTELSQSSWRDFFRYAWVMILKSIASVLPALLIAPGILFLVLALYSDAIILNSIGFFLTFIGAILGLLLSIWLSVRLAFAGYAMLLDDDGGMRALKRSFQVTNGRFWATLWRILIPKLVFGSGILIAELVIGLLLPLLVSSLYGFGDTFGLYAGMLVTIFLTTGIRILYPPLFILADEILYDSLKSTNTAS